jgi:hypothetical protein
MSKRIIVSLAAAGLVLAAGIGTAAEASAATPAASVRASAPASIGKTTGNAVHPDIVSGCSASYFCFWNNANFNDGPGKLSGNNPSWYVFSHSSCPNGTWADCASSLDNAGTSGMYVDVYTGVNYTGWAACIADNATYSNLANEWYGGGSGPNMNDTIVGDQWEWTC